MTTYSMSQYGMAEYRMAEHRVTKYSWAGAATPTQRSATRPQESPGKDSIVFQRTPLLGESATGAPDPAPRKGHDRQDTWAAWLIDIPRRIGNRLFLDCDEEAYWRGWEIKRTWGGLARTYRDPRFDARRSALRANQADGKTDGAR
jgi:hypothetical protein